MRNHGTNRKTNHHTRPHPIYICEPIFIISLRYFDLSVVVLTLVFRWTGHKNKINLHGFPSFSQFAIAEIFPSFLFSKIKWLKMERKGNKFDSRVRAVFKRSLRHLPLKKSECSTKSFAFTSPARATLKRFRTGKSNFYCENFCCTVKRHSITDFFFF